MGGGRGAAAGRTGALLCRHWLLTVRALSVPNRRVHLCQTSKGSEGARCALLPANPAAAAAAAATAAIGPPGLALLLPPSQGGAHSAAPRRDFVLSGYQELKKANPTFPILVRECGGVEAKLVARYGAPPHPLLPAWLLICSIRGRRGLPGCCCAGRTAPAALLRTLIRTAAERQKNPKRAAAHCPLLSDAAVVCAAPPAADPAAAAAADFGVEEAVRIEGLGKSEISKQLEALVRKGEGMPRSAESEGAL